MILDPQEQKRRLSLRLEGIESGRALIGPATVRFHLTDVCNVACHFCWEHKPGTSYRPNSKNNLPFEVFEKTVHDCVGLQVDAIHLSGLGEPTLHPQFYDMLHHLERDFAVTIYSNGTFPIERCRDILRADHIIINLGESDRAGYRALYGRDFFIKVIKNIRELVRLRSQFNPDFYIEVVVVVTPANEASQLRTEVLARKLGVDRVVRTVSQEREYLRPEPEENGAIEWPPCYHGWFYSAINLNGNVNVCCFMERLTIGNVFKTPFKEIWGSEEYSRARASALTGDPFRKYSECINCLAAHTNKKYASQMEMYSRSRKA